MGEESWAEYQRVRKNRKATAYKQRNVRAVIDWRKRHKLKLIEYKGGKCERCGYDKPFSTCYDFHHLNPQEKEFQIGGSTKGFERLKKEVDKCMLLCKNCHSEIHDIEYESIHRNKVAQYQLMKSEVNVVKNHTITTEEKFEQKNPAETKKKAERPNKEYLMELLWSEPTVLIASRYGVSDVAVAKWAKSYGINKPPRGYWAKMRSLKGVRKKPS